MRVWLWSDDVKRIRRIGVLYTLEEVAVKQGMPDNEMVEKEDGTVANAVMGLVKHQDRNKTNVRPCVRMPFFFFFFFNEV